MIGNTNMWLPRFITIFVLAIVSADVSAAGEAAGAPAAEALTMPRLSPLAMDLPPGQWREYRYVGGPSNGARVRWTWLDTLEREGQSFQWFETRMIDGDSQTVSKVLANRSNPGAVPAVVLMQKNDQQVVEMPAAMRVRAADVLQLSGVPPKEIKLSEIEVPAGQFATTMYVIEQAGVTQRIHVSESLPGMVLIETPDFRMELVATGSDGQSLIAKTRSVSEN
jgi:hypothetical protein